MRVPQQQLTNQQEQDLATARQLAKLGVPIFLLTRTNNKGELVPPSGWQRSLAIDSDRAIARWRPGFGLGAVCGTAVDVLDVDPRNGGSETWAALKAAGRVPAVYGVSATASGGWHHWIAPTRLTKRSRGGVDLLTGDADGSGRSFCYIPPTERRSKTTGAVVKYEWLTEPDWDGIALASAPDFENVYAASLGAWFDEGKRKPKARPSKSAAGAGGSSGYGERALTENLAEIRNAPDGKQNNTLNSRTHAIAQLWAGGMLGPVDSEREAELRDRIRDAAGHTLMDAGRIEATLNSGWAAGVADPRDNTTYAPDPADLWPSPREPQEVARRWLDEQGRQTVRHWRGNWWRYRPELGCWVDSEDLIADLAARLGQVKHLNKDGAPIPWNPTPKTIRDVQAMTEAEVRLSREVEQPAWLQPDPDDPAGLIPFRNGLLRIADRALRPSTPDLFVASARPFDWDPAAPSPVIWLDFLDSIWRKDADAIALLQEWMGYVLSGRMDAQKLLVLVGPPRSGKGTIARVLTQLVGVASVSSSTLDGAGRQFGMQPWIGKSLVLFPDVRSGWGDQTPTLERLLSVTGGDLQNVHRKGVTDWVGVLGARVMIMSNDLPKLKDDSGAIMDRMLMLQLIRSFVGKEDRTLAGRLELELPGILRWALDGLDRLIRRDLVFTVPASAKSTTEQMREQVSPVAVFDTEELDRLDPEERTAIDVMYAAWVAWHRERGLPHGDTSAMGRELRSAIPDLERRIFIDPDGQRRTAYRGIRLRCLETGAGVSRRPATGPQAGRLCGLEGCTEPNFYETKRCWAHRVAVSATPKRDR